MIRCIFCGREFEGYSEYDLPRPDVLDDEMEVLKQICPQCLSLEESLC